MAQQAEKAAELQDPEIRAELDRRARDDGKTVIKSGTGGKSLDAQERLAEGPCPFYVSSLFCAISFTRSDRFDVYVRLYWRNSVYVCRA